MHYNQQTPWMPHHTASFSVSSNNGRAPPPRPRHSTLPGSNLAPQLPISTSSFPSRPVPTSLTPGRRPSPIDFGVRQQQQQPPSAILYNSPTSVFASPQHTSLYGDYFYPRPHHSLPPPPVPQKPLGIAAPSLSAIPRPPVPPKPLLVYPATPPRNPLYPQSIPGPVPGPSSQPTPSEESPIDDNDIALALALSESEARRQEEAILAQEEADLVKALEESRTFASNYSSYVSNNFIDRRQDFPGWTLDIFSVFLIFPSGKRFPQSAVYHHTPYLQVPRRRKLSPPDYTQYI
ncbi:uncharacterized protein EDB91DRAFT_527752 [Suillus paluster]|uniref:uncharacterized protein n=1 Tax=Suillus paluster TaxID=48578 RepID=UPI001B876E8B|nr:uncharacterized protein EDB91DRAFT_527752 [Suillus paluster]KAG1752640.1 hypothetical protein EDB91DRAFT_527752 [Suillus paluster]